MTIVSMSLAIASFVKLTGVTNDVYGVVKTWETSPILNIKTVPAGVLCPAGYASLNFYGAKFGGTQHGSCACSVSSLSSVSTTTNCSTAQFKDTCQNDPTTSGVGLSNWRRENICILSGGQPVLGGGVQSGPSKVDRRPIPKNGKCPANYQMCGVGSYDSSRSICFPSNSICPLTKIAVVTTSSVASLQASCSASNCAVSNWVPLGTLDGGFYTLIGRSQYPGELPIVLYAIDLAEGASSNLANPTSNSNRRGKCLDAGLKNGKSIDEQALPKSTVTPSVTTTGAVTWSSQRFPSACGRSDPRWTLADSLDMESLYLSNFQTQVPDCQNGGKTLYALTDPRYLSNLDPDYQKSGSSLTGYQTIAQITGLTAGCKPTDYICKSILKQTVCGHYVNAAHSMSGIGVTAGLYTQQEIYWDSRCTTTPDGIRSQQKDLKASIAALEAVMVISVICGFFGGIIGPCLGLSKHHGIVQVTEIHDAPETEEWWNPALTLLKIIPIIAALIVVNHIYTIYLQLQKEKCSDSQTNKTFTFLAVQLPQAYNDSISNIAMDSLLFIYGLYHLIRKYRKARHLLSRTSVDAYGRQVVMLDVDSGKLGKPIQEECFCAFYTYTLPSDIATGSKIYLYRDGEVWSTLQGRDSHYVDMQEQRTFATAYQFPVFYRSAAVFPVGMAPMAVQPAIQMQPQFYPQPVVQPQPVYVQQPQQQQMYPQQQQQQMYPQQQQQQQQMYVAQPQQQQQMFIAQPQQVYVAQPQQQQQMYAPQPQQVFQQPYGYAQ